MVTIKYLLLHTFHRTDLVYWNRINKLRKENPNIIIAPVFGIGNKLFFPPTFPRARKRIFPLLNIPSLYWLNSKIANKVEPLQHHNEIKYLYQEFKRRGMSFYYDCTPLGYYNQDIAILDWFLNYGQYLDFDYLIFNEYDLYINKTVEEIYNKYTSYDAGFVNYSRIESNSGWWFAHAPGYGRESLSKWLNKQGKKIILYQGFFPGCLLSRKVLEKLITIKIPHGFCELRLPTLISNLDFSCTKLDFPMVQFLKKHNIADIKENNNIVHPVYGDLKRE